nr:MAG TPA: hypothetical protein [Inoviridae sp.]
MTNLQLRIRGPRIFCCSLVYFLFDGDKVCHSFRIRAIGRLCKFFGGIYGKIHGFTYTLSLNATSVGQSDDLSVLRYNKPFLTNE